MTKNEGTMFKFLDLGGKKMGWRISYNEHRRVQQQQQSRRFTSFFCWIQKENKWKTTKWLWWLLQCVQSKKVEVELLKGVKHINGKMKKEKKKEFIWLCDWFGKTVGGREKDMRDFRSVCDKCETPSISSVTSLSALVIHYSYITNKKIFNFINWMTNPNYLSLLHGN